MLPTYDEDMARDLRRHHEDAVRITTASSSRDVEINARQRRYIYSMGVRTVCFVSAILVEGWLRWVLVAAALILPYIAVVMANNSGSKDDGFELLDGTYGKPELESGAESERPPGPERL
jgi:hypothetical protein